MPATKTSVLPASALLWLLLLALLSGCGSGGDDAATASEPLTKAQIVKRWTAICDAEDKVKNQRMVAASKKGNAYLAGSKDELTELVRTVVLPYYDELIDEMAALNPPIKDKAEVKRIIAKFRDTFAGVKANPREFITNDTFYYPNQMVNKYGAHCTL